MNRTQLQSTNTLQFGLDYNSQHNMPGNSDKSSDKSSEKPKPVQTVQNTACSKKWKWKTKEENS